MTPEIESKLLLWGNKFFTTNKMYWDTNDIYIIYKLRNDILGLSLGDKGYKPVTNCGSCRRETILFVRDSYNSLIKRVVL